MPVQSKWSLALAFAYFSKLWEEKLFLFCKWIKKKKSVIYYVDYFEHIYQAELYNSCILDCSTLSIYQPCVSSP